MQSKRILPYLATLVVGGLISCGGGGGGSATVTGTGTGGSPTPSRSTGFDVPSEISPVSTGSQAAPAKVSASPLFSLVAAASAADAGTDYSNAKTIRFVAERSVNQFDIIQTILNAAAQTRYADPENINAGPYTAIVAWQENDKGAQGKMLQTWVVDSTLFVEGGRDVNRVRCWIEEEGHIIKAEFRIYASATKRSDGSYQDYGVWDLNAKLDDAGTSFFTARASIGSSGETVVSINEQEAHGGPTELRKAVMHKSESTGYGKVSFPEWRGSGSPAQSTVAYAYNSAQLRINDGARDVYKDRASNVAITHRYGMYDATTGADVLKSHSFGFPVSFSLSGGQQWGYYGAFQGRHQLWAGPNSGSVPDGTVVTRRDRGDTLQTYKTLSFPGTLTKRTLVDRDISDLLNLPVETWVNFHHQIQWDGSQWLEGGAPYTDFASLVNQPRKWVGIHGWDNIRHQPRELIYVDGSGFFEATRDPNTGQMASTGVPYVPALNDQLWIDIGGSIYLEYQGASGWVQKRLASFDERTWTPAFDPAGDAPYVLELDRQYYINKQGGNYVVTRTGASSYLVKVEIQTAANPVNASTLLSGVATFRSSWSDPQNPGNSSTYRFVVDPQSPLFLKLVYATVGTQDAQASPAPQVGDPVTAGLWGLAAFDSNGQDLALQFNWDYPRSGENWGTQTFLYNDDGAGQKTYTLLDDPIQLQPITVQANGQTKTLSLQFDGWFHGLPEFFDELARNSWSITNDVANKIINLPEGTQVVNALNPALSYLIKPLEIGLYLRVAGAPDASLSLTSAQAIDLSDPAVVPSFVDPNMGPVPTGTVIKYSEGNRVR